MTDIHTKGELATPVVSEMTNLFTPSNTFKPLESGDLKAKNSNNNFMSLHSDDFLLNSTLVGTKSINLLSALAETQDFDDSYAASRTQTFVAGDVSTRPFMSSSFNNFFTSSVKTFNNFTTSHTDFISYTPRLTDLSSLLFTSESTSVFGICYLDLLGTTNQLNPNATIFKSLGTLLAPTSPNSISPAALDLGQLSKLLNTNFTTKLSFDQSTQPALSRNQHVGNLFKLANSNYLNIRASVKDSVVNYNAFQKVFRSRFDESRSHSN